MKWTISERVMNAARTLVAENRIIDIMPLVDQNIWLADVMDDQLYHVELDGSPKEQDRCTCDNWTKQHYCQHTVACELYLQQKKLSRVIDKELDYSEYFHTVPFSTVLLQRMKKVHHEVLENQAIPAVVPLFEPRLLEDNQQFVLEFRVRQVGENRRYVIRDIPALLEAYQKQTVFQNGDHYYQMTELTENDQMLLATLSRMSDEQLSLEPRKVMEKRTFSLTKWQFEEVVVLLEQQKRLAIMIDNQIYHHLEFYEEKPLPITFNVAQKAQDLIITAEYCTVYYKQYDYVRDGYEFYTLNKAQKEWLMHIQFVAKNQRVAKVVYKENQWGDVLTYVLPVLQQLGTVHMSQELENHLIQTPLLTRFYLRKIQNQILLRVDYQYGHVLFSSDDQVTSKANQRRYVVRDYQKEWKIEYLVEQLGFKKQRRNYLRALPKDTALYTFFTQDLSKLEVYGEVNLDPALQALYVSPDNLPNIQVSEYDSWLDIRFDISGIPQDEIASVLETLQKHQTFYQLDDGRLLDFNQPVYQQTSKVLEAVREGMVTSEGTIRLPKYRAFQVKDAVENIGDTHFSTTFNQLTYDLTHPNEFSVSVPCDLQATLRDYQVAGFKWMKMLSHYRLGGILADDMGLGKTVQTIAYLLSEKEEDVTTKALIITPASLIYNWQSEIQKFAPKLRVAVIHGAKEMRMAMLDKNEAWDVVITSYTNMRQDYEHYKDLALNIMILDEAQMVKNAATKTFSSIKSLPIEKRFALSGTPIENNLNELWTLFQVLMPGFFPSMAQFKKMAPQEIAQMIQPFVLRRQKQVVLKDLPDKVETPMYSSLTEDQKAVYLAHLTQMRQEVQSMDHETFKKNRMPILAGLTRLRQICCTPALFMPEYHGESGKINQVRDLLVQAKENGRRVLLFSQFTTMLDILENEVKKLGLASFYLNGQTKAKDRLEMVEAFNNGERDIFLISLKAGGTGLNLTGADTVILFDMWWNPAVEEQAMSRAHRIGQQKSVEVWRLIAEGTIEEKMNSLQKEKRMLFDTVLNDQNSQNLQNLTEEDIRDILNYGE